MAGPAWLSRSRLGRDVSQAAPLLITGYPGAGKSHVASHLDGWVVTELDGWRDPLDEAGDAPILCVADVVNLNATLKDPLAAALIRHQLAVADAVVLARTDLVDAAAVRDQVIHMTEAPLVEAGELPGLVPRSNRPGPIGGLEANMETWHYHGPLCLTAPMAEKLAERRPKGAYRLCGQVLTAEGGLEIEIAGRFRQTRPIRDPGETRLQAWGLKPGFRARDMDVFLSELAADSAARRNQFRYR